MRSTNNKYLKKTCLSPAAPAATATATATAATATATKL